MLYQPIKSALESVFSAEQGDTRRLFHGRGHMHDGLEHINIDWYPPVLLVTAYEEIQSLDDLQAIISESDANNQIGSIILQKRYTRGAPSEEIGRAHV